MPVCTHCLKLGHDIAACYQFYGFREWWGQKGKLNISGANSNRGRGGRTDADREEAGTLACSRNCSSGPLMPNGWVNATHELEGSAAAVVGGSRGSATFPSLSSEQWSSLLSILHNHSKLRQTIW